MNESLLTDSYLSVPFEEPVVGVVQVDGNERLHDTALLLTTSAIDTAGKERRVATSQGHTHEVVET